ncbi:hypothetical protein WJX72_003833 [[Myrmecia] bisecta]|uniref:CBF1-interacting co-repressor CIR N-terminal domain-containing protein n=1 Tax=[Myrmecia] bisecta TaxID=41462 RepID=A0AAW1PLE5_9CHLO
MGKGGPMAFLNKKGWHPGNARNQEKVWQKQEEHAKEQQKLDDLRKQLAEERAREELVQVAVAGGHKQAADRLDWMYQGGVTSRQEADKRNEDQLLGSKLIEQEPQQDVSQAEKVALLPTFYAEDTPASANETWARLHSDPLFAIKQQEIAARKRIMANPVQMDNIKKEVHTLQERLKLDKKAKKEAKRAKKEAKKEKKHRKADKEAGADVGLKRSRSASPDTGRRQRPRSSSPEAGGKGRPNSHQPASNGHRHEVDDEELQRFREALEGPGPDAPSDRHRRHDAHASAHRLNIDRRAEQGSHRSQGHDPQGPGRRRSPEPTRHREADRSGERDDQAARGQRDSHRDHRLDDKGQRDSRREDERDRRGSHGDRDSRRAQDDHTALRHRGQNGRHEPSRDGHQAAGPGSKGVPEPVVHVDGASAQGRDLTWGLNYSGLAHNESDKQDRREATRKHLEAAAKQREAEEKEKAAQRYVKKEYKTGCLTEEERAKRLAEMAGNADVHDEARWARLKHARDKDEAADAADAPGKVDEKARHHSNTAAFLKQATKEVYGTAGEGASLEDRVGRRKFYADNSGSAAFRRS